MNCTTFGLSRRQISNETLINTVSTEKLYRDTESHVKAYQGDLK